MFRTARIRLVAWNVLVLMLILGVLGYGVYSFYLNNLYREVDQQLHSQLDRVAANGNDPFLPRLPSEPAYRVVVANLEGVVTVSSDCPTTQYFTTGCRADSFRLTSTAAMRAALNDVDHTDIRTVRFRGDSQRVLTYVIQGDNGIPGIIQISRSVAPEQAGLNELRRLLYGGGLLALVLTALGSFFLANRALIPIRQAFARQRKFTADASHELRTPLALIRANAEMLCRHGEGLREGDAELVGEIIRETDHLNRLVSDLLTLARADSESAEINTKPVDLRALVSDVHEDLQRIAESRGIESQAVVNGPVTVEGDETRLRQLLLILLDNALKYTDPGGKVDISLDRVDGRARLAVSDTGVGIPPQDLPHIFDRFYRVDRAREHESGGTGLGLAIAKWIAQAHHGSIKVQSEVGRGTRFQVELPARQGPPPESGNGHSSG
jgi:signal transduction histidine kinase